MGGLKFVALLALCILLTHCVVPFESEIFDFDKVLVVDGQFTDELTHQKVQLSNTSPIGDNTFRPLAGAMVTVEGDDNSSYEFYERTSGFYESVDEVAGTPGVSYQLLITTPDDRHYESTPSKLIASPPIDSVYTRYVEITTEESTYLTKGIQFFLDAQANEDATYFSYEWDEVAKIQAPFPSKYAVELVFHPGVFIGPNQYPDWYSASIRIRDDTITPCYPINHSKELLILSTVSLSENKIREFPIRYITNQTDELRYRYVITVRQYALSEDTYSFYKRLKESSESGGSLFDKQQGTITGNIRSVESPRETVLGFFSVAGVSKYRRFFSPSDLDPRYSSDYRYSCEDGVYKTLVDSIPYWWTHKAFLELIDYVNKDYVLYSTKRCTRCDWFASIYPPDFWEE